MIDPIRRRADVDDCACLRCRRVESAVRRRGFGDHLYWGLNLVRRRPSIPGVVLALVALEVLEWQIGLVPARAAAVFDVAPLLILPVLAFRGYVAALAAGDLGGQRPSAGHALAHTLRRLPAIVAATAGLLLVSGVALVIAILGASILYPMGLAVDGALGLGIVSDSVFDGVSASLIFGGAMAAAIFKCWLAPEICVAGGYGPVTALRLSWSITTTHRSRMLVVMAGFVLTILAPHVVEPILVTIAGPAVLESVWVAALGLFAQLLLQAVWFAVGTAIYVGAVLDREPVEAVTGRDVLAGVRNAFSTRLGRPDTDH